MANKTFLISGNCGQGKSSFSRNLASALRHFGFDVLLVDCDFKTPRQGHYFGIPLAERTLQEVLHGMRTLTNALYETPSGIKLLLSSIAHVPTPPIIPLLSDIQQLADIVLIDTPNYDPLLATKLPTILVTHADFPSILDLRKLLPIANVQHIILNRVHLGELSETNAEHLLSKPIIGSLPADPSYREALTHGYSLIELHPEHPMSSCIFQIAAKLMNLDYQSPLEKSGLLTK